MQLDCIASIASQGTDRSGHGTGIQGEEARHIQGLSQQGTAGAKVAESCIQAGGEGGGAIESQAVGVGVVADQSG